MTETPRLPSLRIVPGELETRSAMTRLILPTSAQPVWPPYHRVGETAADRARPFPAHSHEHEEVLTFVRDGFASYQTENGPVELLQAGSARLLTSPSRTTHRISPARGGAIRWFNLVVALPVTVAGPRRLQSSEAPATPFYEENAIARPLVGPQGPMSSDAGLECRELTFVESSTSFLRVGHDRRGLVYAFSGRGIIEDHGLETGEAALVEGAAGIAIHGTPGLQVIAITAPR